MSNNKLLIQLVVDNSATMKGEKIDKLNKALGDFASNLTRPEAVNIELSAVIFEALRPRLVKEFTNRDFNCKISASGIPIFNGVLNYAIDNLNKRMDELKNAGEALYKPWLVVLFDGKNFGDLNDLATRLTKTINDGLLTYFPFLITDLAVDESLKPLFMVKRPLSVIPFMYDELMKWIYDIALKRIAIPVNQSFSLDPKSLEGWVKK